MSVLIVHVLRLHLRVYSAGVEKTIEHIALCLVRCTLFCVWLLTKSCFASAAHEEIVAIKALREVSTVGKEMIDGNRAVATVAASTVMDCNVFPGRNSTRDKETTKEVVDVINTYDLIPVVGQAEVWKGSYFLEFKVGQAHTLAKWAIFQGCIANKDYHLVCVSRGGATVKDRDT